jgi:hypothetical protein
MLTSSYHCDQSNIRGVLKRWIVSWEITDSGASRIRVFFVHVYGHIRMEILTLVHAPAVAASLCSIHTTTTPSQQVERVPDQSKSSVIFKEFFGLPFLSLLNFPCVVHNSYLLKLHPTLDLLVSTHTIK